MKKERNLFAKKVMKDKIVFKLILDWYSRFWFGRKR
jgi:hypothetical protein